MAESIEELKICVDCGIDKPFSQYHKLTRRSGKKSVQSRCIQCMSEYKKKRYWGNREEELSKMTKSRLKPENVLQRKAYYEKNKSEYRQRYLNYMQDPAKKIHKRNVGVVYEKNNADKIRDRKKRYYQKDDVKERRKEKHRIKRVTDIQYSIKRRLRFRLKHEINRLRDKKFIKTYSTFDLVGCEFSKLKTHIESLFTEGMTWDKLLNGQIHIDHIKPCKRFDLSKESEQRKCFHYTNLQPLWEIDNLKKGAKYQEQKAA